MVHECGLSDTGPSNDANDIDLWIFPSGVQKRNVLLAAKHLAGSDRQSGHGDFFRSSPGGRPASYAGEIG